MVAPTGVEDKMEIVIPLMVQIRDNTADITTTLLKVSTIFIADKGGNTISAEINNEPTNFIPNTMTVAKSIARIRLYSSTLCPVAFAKFSSKVMAKNL